MAQVSALSTVDMLHAHLRARLGELRPLVVVDVVDLFLEVSSLPCKEKLVSLEFAFDEDEGRLARLEARFAQRGAVDAFGSQLGFRVELLLPRVIPALAPGGDATARVLATVAAERSLVSRFVRALADLGAYTTVASLVALEAEAELL